jgi:hypothetical protein
MIKLKSTIFIFITVLIGVFFIYSALLKLFPLEPFEYYLYSKTTIWSLVQFISRFIISFEILLGLFLIIHYRIRLITSITIITLLLFSIYLVYLLIFDPDSNCFCMGAKFYLPPSLSLIKNAVLIVVLLFIRKYNSGVLHINKLVLIILLVLTLLIPYIFEPYKVGTNYSSDEFKYSNVKEFLPEEKYIEVSNTKSLAVFISFKCEHCIKILQKINLLVNKNPSLTPKILVFHPSKSEEKLNDFIEKTESHHLNFYYLPDTVFLVNCQYNFPKVYLVENGITKSILSNNSIMLDILE